jgi:hypothetical protein
MWMRLNVKFKIHQHKVGRKKFKCHKMKKKDVGKKNLIIENYYKKIKKKIVVVICHD